MYAKISLQGGNLSIHAQKKPGDDSVKLARLKLSVPVDGKAREL